MSNAKASISIDGPCCQSDRLAVDHAGVAKANSSATAIAAGTGKSWRAITYMITAVKATIAEAMRCSVHECSATIGSPATTAQPLAFVTATNLLQMVGEN